MSLPDKKASTCQGSIIKREKREKPIDSKSLSS